MYVCMYTCIHIRNNDASAQVDKKPRHQQCFCKTMIPCSVQTSSAKTVEKVHSPLLYVHQHSPMCLCPCRRTGDDLSPSLKEALRARHSKTEQSGVLDNFCECCQHCCVCP